MKNYTEQERYNLAKELEYIASSMELDGQSHDIDPEEIKYRMDVLERAVYAVCPDYDQRLVDAVEEDANDPEFQEVFDRICSSEQSKAFVQDIEAHRNGSMSLEQLKEKWGSDAPPSGGVVDFNKAKKGREQDK